MQHADATFVRFLCRIFMRICRMEYDQDPGIGKSVVGATGRPSHLSFKQRAYMND